MSKKYVYLFSEGNANMRELLGGKGANLAEMTNIGLPVPQGFTITTEACTQYYEDGQKINDEIQAEIMEYIAKMEEHHRQEVRRSGEPPAGLRPFRRPGLHARHDGHHPEPGPERGRGGRHGQEVRQPPLGLGLLPPLYPDVLRRGHGGGQEVLRAAHRPDEGGTRRHPGRGADRRGPEGAGRPVQGRVQGQDRRRTSPPTPRSS